VSLPWPLPPTHTTLRQALNGPASALRAACRRGRAYTLARAPHAHAGSCTLADAHAHIHRADAHAKTRRARVRAQLSDRPVTLPGAHRYGYGSPGSTRNGLRCSRTPRPACSRPPRRPPLLARTSPIRSPHLAAASPLTAAAAAAAAAMAVASYLLFIPMFHPSFQAARFPNVVKVRPAPPRLAPPRPAPHRTALRRLAPPRPAPPRTTPPCAASSRVSATAGVSHASHAASFKTNWVNGRMLCVGDG
jgi:hypothetical protein